MEGTEDGEIFKSILPCDPSKIPNVPLTDYIFKFLRKNLQVVAENPWLFDVCSGKKVLFKEVEELARKVASGLARRGFSKGDILYFVSYDIVDIGILQLAVWLLGGATRGSFQIEEPEEFQRQMNEVQCKFVAVDCETVQSIKRAISLADMDCTIINVGDADVDGALKFSELSNDDGTAFPENVEIDPKNDVLLICNTSGSTGTPKGVMHTHETVVSIMACFEGMLAESYDESILITASNFAISNAWTSSVYLATGNTMYCIGRYKKEEFLDHVLKFKPRKLFLYPYISSWLARSTELQKHDLSFIKDISLGGSVVDPTTMRLLQKAFPKAYINLAYASTETMGVSITLNSARFQLPLLGTSPDGEEMVASGVLFPLVQAKVIDLETQKLLGRNKLGKLYVKATHIMKGYLVHKGREPNRSCFDEEGWFDTGDVAFFDSNGQLFVRERVSFMFKYYMHFVNPSEIEAILQEHPAVQMACVIGVPNKETTNLAKAIVVLKEGKTASEEELIKLVADKLPFYKHLYGGLQFVDSLPENKGRKVDRVAIMKIYA
ncbi:luciferin 4-monooxygenase-like [Cloeon dipterum]|uniref:luciferin 4-monooxygenase-like n=1 Tax=Cloeon dipterum TaxID=197152 RepID=UPI00321F8A59